MIKIEIANEQSDHDFDSELLQQAVRLVLTGESFDESEISVALVDDATIRVLNRKYLQHDYPTDVLSFLLSTPGEPLDGEVIVSAETAAREAGRYGWSMSEELLLYLIHGTLHLVGYDDVSDADRASMRSRERHYLEELGHQTHDEERVSEVCAAPESEHPAEGDA